MLRTHALVGEVLAGRLIYLKTSARDCIGAAMNLKNAKWASAGVTAFVAGTAAFTLNAGLIMLAGLGAASTVTLWAKGRSNREEQ